MVEVLQETLAGKKINKKELLQHKKIKEFEEKMISASGKTTLPFLCIQATTLY